MTMSQQTTDTAGTIAAKAAPPAVVVGAKIVGIEVADWIQWVTLAYVILMFCHKAWHMGLEAYNFWVLKQRGAPKDGD